MLDSRVRKFIDVPLIWMAKQASHYNINANGVTIAGFVIGLLGAGVTAFEWYWFGFALILVNRLFDGLDGVIARHQNQVSDVGGYLDIVLDFIFYSAVPLGFGLANPSENAIAAMILMLSFVGTGSSFLAYAIFAAKLGIDEESEHGNKSFSYSSGLMEGSETILAFGLFYVFPNHFWWLALVVALLCAITALGRIYETCRILQQPTKKPSRKSP